MGNTQTSNVAIAPLGGWWPFSSETSNTAKVLQDTRNSIFQSTTNQCSFVCSNKYDHLQLIVENSKGINIDLSNTCSVLNSSCLMKTALDANIKNILDAMISQTAKTTTGPYSFLNNDKASNYLEISQFISNNLTQQVTNNCQVTASNSLTNAYIYVTGSENININAAQTGIIDNSLCNMETTSKAVIFNQATANGDQTATVDSLGCTDYFNMIIAVVICLVIGGVVIAVAFAIIRSINAKQEKTKKEMKNNRSMKSREIEKFPKMEEMIEMEEIAV